jgi:hypothetical protein
MLSKEIDNWSLRICQWPWKAALSRRTPKRPAGTCLNSAAQVDMANAPHCPKIEQGRDIAWTGGVSCRELFALCRPERLAGGEKARNPPFLAAPTGRHPFCYRN